jgi:hypothetical protein
MGVLTQKLVIISFFLLSGCHPFIAKSELTPAAISEEEENSAPTLTAITMLTGGITSTAKTITYAQLAAAADEADIDGDTLSFRIESVSTGTLTKNSVAVVDGSTLISTGESVEWTPPGAGTGDTNIFMVKAYDGELASDTAIQVVLTVYDTPVLTSLSQDAGVAGNSITLTGTGFRTGIIASVDGVNCTTSTYVSVTSMTCVLPTNTTIEEVSVTVTNTDTQSDTLTNELLNLGSPAVWLSATDITPVADGTALSTWSDSSGNNNDAAHGTAGNQPAYYNSCAGLNNQPCVRFDGVDDFLILNSEVTSRTIFSVSEAIGTSDNRVLYASSSANNTYLRNDINNTEHYLEIGGNVISNSSPQLQIFNTLLLDGTDISIRTNGGNVSTNASALTFSLGQIGELLGGGSGTDPYSGNFAEVLAYTTALTNAEISLIETYLQMKY